MRRRLSALVAAAGALGLSAGCGGASVEGPPPGAYRGSEPPARIAMPRFVLQDERGKVVDSSELRGKVILLTFLDSQCTDSCPLIAFQVARTLDRLGEDERRQVAAVAISTDPAEDTRPAIRSFLRKQRALGRLHYVGGEQPLKQLRSVWRSFKVLASVETGEDSLHSAPVRVFDRRGIWVSTLHPGVDLTRANLVHDIELALAN